MHMVRTWSSSIKGSSSIKVHAADSYFKRINSLSRINCTTIGDKDQMAKSTLHIHVCIWYKRWTKSPKKDPEDVSMVRGTTTCLDALE